MAVPACILVVDHNPYNLELLSTLLECEGYQTVGATTLEELDQALASAVSIHLAVVDIDGFDQSIWAHCEELRTRGIPLLIIATGTNMYCRSESFQHGAHGLLVKPLISVDLVAMIGNLLEVRT